jgi:hypothetical protein
MLGSTRFEAQFPTRRLVEALLDKRWCNRLYEASSFECCAPSPAHRDEADRGLDDVNYLFSRIGGYADQYVG